VTIRGPDITSIKARFQAAAVQPVSRLEKAPHAGTVSAIVWASARENNAAINLIHDHPLCNKFPPPYLPAPAIPKITTRRKTVRD
jgi:hypothetical protein